MSDSIRDAATAHNNDVARVLHGRRKLLEQLYATTVSFLGLKIPKFHDDGIESFLHANDITKERLFNPSTLPGANLPQYLESKAVNVDHDSTASLALNRDSRIGADESNLADNGSHFAIPSLHDSVKPGPDAEGISAVETIAKAHERRERYRESAQESGQPGEVALNAVEESERNKSSHEYPLNALPRSYEDGGLEKSHEDKRGPKNRDERQHSTLEPTPQVDFAGFGLTKDGLSPPDLGGETLEGNVRGSRKASEIRENVEENKNNQMGSSTGASASSDNQPHVAESQSIPNGSHDQAHSSPDLPSQFLHSSLDDGEPMGGVSSLQNEQDSHVLPGGPMIDDDNTPIEPPVGLRSGMNGEASRDLTFSRRPPMRIDTGISSISNGSATLPQNKSTLTGAGASQAATPSKSTQIQPSAHSPPERMMTRVSSGALRHKSVSEILGETPRSNQAHADRANADTHHEDSATAQTPKSASSVISPDPAIFRQRLNEINQKEKNSKLSTVVFAKPHSASNPRISDVSAEALGSVVEETPIKDRNYLLTWLVTQVYMPSPTHLVERKPLNTLLRQAHKTLRTSDIYVDFDERQYCRILSKIQELQMKGRWSLRQPVRCPEPTRPATHWDVVLGQMKWMRTDFREERKWKAAGAKYLAEICAQWIISSPKERESQQIKLKVNRSIYESQSSTPAPTPDLVHLGEDDDTEAIDEDLPEPGDGEAPAAIFSLPPDMFVFGLNKSPVSEKILHELPLYLPNAEAESGVLGATDVSPDGTWKMPLVPISKYAQGKIVSCEEGPPRKRSRYSYSDSDGPPVTSANETSEQIRLILEPENNDIALFNPEHKHIRDRIHTGHAFRPPSEHIMPSQSFFECRQPSQWTLVEDDELRRLVRDYAYNWSLVSSCLTPSSLFSSGAERRTPWECFERWVALEGLPTEMSKINYFRAYHSRLQDAQRVFEAQQQQVLQQHPNNSVQPIRRRSTQPFTVDRRKNNKHIHLIDAMRKLARKRENKLLKDQHLSTAASLRKNNEPQKPRQQIYTPREFSRMKFESQMKREEQYRAARLQYIQQQHQRANMVQRATAGQQALQQPNGAQLPRNLAAGAPGGNSPNMRTTGPLRVGGGSSAPPMQRPINGQANGVVPANAHGVPHAPMQPHMQMPMGQRMPPQLGQNMLYAATQVQAEQQAQLQRQRHLQHSQISGQASSPNMQSLNPITQNNSNMLGSMDGRSSPAVNGARQQTPVNSASPNMTQPQTLSSGLTPAVNQIHNQIKLRNPQASPEQIRSATTEQLYRMSQQHAAHQAMQVATGNTNANAAAANGNMPGLNSASPMQPQALMTSAGSPMLNPQQYAQLMMEQQRKQQGQRSGSISSGTPGVNGGSRGATPINQQNGNAQSGRGLSQSPRQGQVGVVGAQ